MFICARLRNVTALYSNLSMKGANKETKFRQISGNNSGLRKMIWWFGAVSSLVNAFLENSSRGIKILKLANSLQRTDTKDLPSYDLELS